MNERIKELALQAGLIAGEHDDLDFKKELTVKEKKFAELIVDKCVRLAMESESTQTARKIIIYFGDGDIE